LGEVVKPTFVGHPVATLLFACTLGVWLVIEFRQGLNRRADATNTDRGSLAFLRACALAGALLAALASKVTATAFSYGLIMFGIGLAVAWTGIALRWWCFRTLGRYFTFTVMTSANQPVIATGPYRFLRHPSYAGLLLIIVGIGFGYGNWLSLAALILLPLIGFVYRIRVEEAALSATLGDAYTTYARGRKRLIPFVW
jgi:protein-S-isoprenylcysteine O-methyltransferase Ste14